MNETMEKVLEENQLEAQTESMDVVLSDSVSGGDSSVPNARDTMEKLGNSTVSGGDSIFSSSLGANVMVQADADAVQALAEHMASLDFKVSCILFLILFIWCEKKIRNAVGKMTGKGVKV